LSADPMVTAKALRAYDAYLPERLTEAWARIEKEENREPYELDNDTPDAIEF
jgi:hypothetical protein